MDRLSRAIFAHRHMYGNHQYICAPAYLRCLLAAGDADEVVQEGCGDLARTSRWDPSAGAVK